MRIEISDMTTARGTVYTDLTLTTDDGRTVEIQAQHSHCDADFSASDNAPVQVGDMQIRPTQIADCAMLGDLRDVGDALDVTADWLREMGYVGPDG